MKFHEIMITQEPEESTSRQWFATQEVSFPTRAEALAAKEIIAPTGNWLPNPNPRRITIAATGETPTGASVNLTKTRHVLEDNATLIGVIGVVVTNRIKEIADALEALQELIKTNRSNLTSHIHDKDHAWHSDQKGGDTSNSRQG